jgi:hypothetical protein
VEVKNYNNFESCLSNAISYTGKLTVSIQDLGKIKDWEKFRDRTGIEEHLNEILFGRKSCGI